MARRKTRLSRDAAIYERALATALDRRATPAERERASVRMGVLGVSFAGEGRRRQHDKLGLGALICEALDHRIFGPDPA